MADPTTIHPRPLPILRQLRADHAFYRRARGGMNSIAVWFDRMFWVCITYRIGHAAVRCKLPILGHLARFFYAVLNFIVSTITNADIRSGAFIGQRFDVHTSRSLLITNGVIIGDDCMVNAQVCIVGQGNDRREGVPVIGHHVRIGVGAKIMGRVRIGDDCRIGANAVVIRDVPPGHLAVGVPAVNKKRKDLPPDITIKRPTHGAQSISEKSTIIENSPRAPMDGGVTP